MVNTKQTPPLAAYHVALMDIIGKTAPQIRVFTLDTGRLNDET